MLLFDHYHLLGASHPNAVMAWIWRGKDQVNRSMRTINRVSLVMLLLLVTCIASTCQILVATHDSDELQKDNSRQFTRYSNSVSIDELIDDPGRQDPAKEIVVVSSPELHHFEDNPGDHSREAYLMSAAANADLIVIGRPLRRVTHLTETHRFLFSDYTVATKQVLYSPKALITEGQQIVVSSPGGSMEYQGRRIRAVVKGFAMFEMDTPYVFFLRLLPNGSFLVFGEAAYKLDGSPIVSHPQTRDSEVTHQYEEFVEDVRRAIERLKHDGRQ